jgi:hypothetical protein
MIGPFPTPPNGRRRVGRAVWSFWSRPFQARHHQVWASEKHHLLAWILSVETARQHYPETALVTDQAGAALLVEGLGLAFDHVSTELDALEAADPDWWVLGKLCAYRAQTEPFVHLDSDVFLWKRLPDPMNTAPVLAQNSEHFPFVGSWYRPEAFDVAVRATRGWLPPEWTWYVAQRWGEALCCGILGGTDIGFINHYADTAVKIIEHPANQTAWRLLGFKIGDNILFEQYFLSACVAYHANHEASPFHGVYAHCLFGSAGDAFNPDRAAEAGYTHLIGGAKQNEALAARLEARVARDYPRHYRRCLDFVAGRRRHAQAMAATETRPA